MKYVKLKDICDLRNGYAFKSSDYIEKSNTLNCRMSNIRPGANFDIEYSPKFLPDDYTEKYKDYLLNDGDIIIAMTDLANDPKLLGVPTIVKTNGYNVLQNQRVGKLIITNKNEINERYLKYILSYPSLKNYYKKFAGGGLQINIGKEQILNVEIPIEEYDMQVKIADILDKAQELIDKRKEQIEQLDELVKSRFIEIFGDPVSNTMNWGKQALKDIVTDDCTISYGIVQTGDEQKEGVPVFRPVDIVNNRKPILSELKKTTEEISSRYKKTILQGNEILMTVRANIGDTCIIDEKFKGCNVGRGIVPIRLIDKMNPIFVKYQFDSYGVQRELKSLAKGITLIQLNMEDLREFLLITPSVELQNQFADFVKQVDKLKFEMEKSLKELEDNFNALMQKSFKGELF